MPAEIDIFKQLLIALRQILRATDRQSKQIARETGLTTAQFIALQVIDAAVSLTAGDLARALNLGHATVTAILSRLEALDLISRSRPDSDRRRVIVQLTVSGRGLLDDAPRVMQNLLEQRFAALESWEQLHMLGALQRLAGLMDARDPEAAPVLETGSLNRAP